MTLIMPQIGGFYFPAGVSAWDISTAVLAGSLDVSAFETSPTGVSFKPDGTKMYVIGAGSKLALEYDLGTAWDVTTAVYLHSGSVQEFNPRGIFFKPDGTKMYVIGISGDSVYEHNLGTAWDVSTATYSQGFSVKPQESAPSDLYFSDDGLRLYVVGSSSDVVAQYDLTTAWDVSTASHVRTKLIGSNSSGVTFKPDGTKMYVMKRSGNDLTEYDLSTAWDISTASQAQFLDIGAHDTIAYGLFFRDDGLKVYVAGDSNNRIYEFNVG